MFRFSSKQPGEEYYLEFDFSADLAKFSQSIASVISVDAVDSGGASATDSIITASNQANNATSVYVWCKAGADGEDYTITVKILGNGIPPVKLEMDVTLPVRES